MSSLFCMVYLPPIKVSKIVQYSESSVHGKCRTPPQKKSKCTRCILLGGMERVKSNLPSIFVCLFMRLALGFVQASGGTEYTSGSTNMNEQNVHRFDGRPSLKLPPFQDVELLVSGRIPLPGEIIEIFQPAVLNRLIAERGANKKGGNWETLGGFLGLGLPGYLKKRCHPRKHKHQKTVRYVANNGTIRWPVISQNHPIFEGIIHHHDIFKNPFMSPASPPNCLEDHPSQ